MIEIERDREGENQVTAQNGLATNQQQCAKQSFYIAPQRESFCYNGRLLRTKIPYFGILTSEYNLFLVMLSFVCFLSSFCHHMLNINHDLSTVPTRYFESFGFSFERMLWS